MSAFLFTLGIFSFWALIGFAVISVFNPQLRVLQSILVCPSVGVAGTILLVFFINRLGVPVQNFGAILVPTLAIGAAVILAVKRPIFPAKQLLPIFGILVIGLCLIAWPMFRYSFYWLSFCNDDMANYCLAAQRFLNHGFFDQPNLQNIFAGKDYSLVYWFMHVAANTRSGSELMLATVWAFSGFNAHQVFMPTIIALHLVLIAGVGALVAGMSSTKRAPLIAMGLLALSPVITVGTLYQLIGQVGGSVLLTASVTLMYRPMRTSKILLLVPGCVPASLTFSAIFIWYPEVLPFFALGWVLYLLLLVKSRAQRGWKILLPALIVGSMVLLMLNKYVITSLMFMMVQASAGMRSADLSTTMFPFFLVPKGIAAIWGLIPIHGDIREPLLSLPIAAGLLLFFWLGRHVLPRQIKQVEGPVSMLLVMLAMGLLLFFRNNDFGLYKLAMIAQPFLIGVVAIELGQMKLNRKPHLVLIAFATMLPITISQFSYVWKSTGESSSGFIQIPNASSAKVNMQFNELLCKIQKETNEPRLIISETSNVVLAKFQALYGNGLQLLFPARNYFKYIATFSNASLSVQQMAARVNQYSLKSLGDNQLDVLRVPREKGANVLHIYTGMKSEIFNSYFGNTNQDHYFTISFAPVNLLRFIHSSLGNHYYLGDKRVTAFYQMENDPMFTGQKFASLGRHLLFCVINPSKQPRMVMELTSTVVRQFHSELPLPTVQGIRVRFVGRGSGRVFSDPLSPAFIDEIPYLPVDMGRDGKRFPRSEYGLMLLYGRDVSLDSRRITTFGRDISLVSEEQYQAIHPPASLHNFPGDLGNKNLEYSGIYEDGWISERSFFVLSPEISSKILTVKGIVPQIDNPGFSTVLQISIDGNQVVSKKLGLGNFEVQVQATKINSKHRIDINFSKYQQLPGVDGRIIGGKIDFIGYQ